MFEPKPTIEPSWLDIVLVTACRKVRGINRWEPQSATLESRMHVDGDEDREGYDELYLTYPSAKSNDRIWVKLIDYDAFYFWVPDGEAIPILVNPKKPTDATFSAMVPVSAVVKRVLFVVLVVAFFGFLAIRARWMG